MKKGDSVLVYEDPKSRKHFEGIAEILRVDVDDVSPWDELRYCRVRFTDRDTAKRWVSEKDIIPCGK